ncbi:hypothetical protein ACFS2C_10925 [Prauserella oleivorans]|uniref:Uncharacterized protein n=1 Tax=Prauserella oleivorans TaxID=1478153 RepID=A0ABW5W8P5_9PSEU
MAEFFAGVLARIGAHLLESLVLHLAGALFGAAIHPNTASA